MLLDRCGNMAFVFVKWKNPLGFVAKVKKFRFKHQFDKRIIFFVAFPGFKIRIKFPKSGVNGFEKRKFFESGEENRQLRRVLSINVSVNRFVLDVKFIEKFAQKLEHPACCT